MQKPFFDASDREGASDQPPLRQSAKVPTEVAAGVKALFPDKSFGEAVGCLLAEAANRCPVPFSVEATELWIKLDRAEEAIAAVALSNVELSRLLWRYEAHRLQQSDGAARLLAQEIAPFSKSHGGAK